MSHMLLTKTLSMPQFWHIAFVCFNCMSPPFEFMSTKDTLLVDLKFKLDNLLCYPDNRMMVKIECRLPSIDSEGNVKFNKFQLKTSENLRVMWSTFLRYATKGLIEEDVTLTISINDILKMLKSHQPSLSCNVVLVMLTNIYVMLHILYNKYLC